MKKQPDRRRSRLVAVATLSVATEMAGRCFSGRTHFGTPLPDKQEVCADGAGVLVLEVADAPVYLQAKKK